MTSEFRSPLRTNTKPAWIQSLTGFCGRHEFLCLSVLCIALAFFRFLFCGFTYSYTLDDYIQYHNYATSDNYWNLIINVGLFKARPLAGLADLYVFSPLFQNMILGVLLCSVLFGLSAVIFYRIFRKAFGTGIFFLLFYLLIPINIEATYWISAASRITFGLFFTAISLDLFIRFLDKGKTLTAVAACVTHLISISFYEQIFVLSCALWMMAVLMRLIHRKKSKRLLLVLVIFFNAAFYFTFIGLFPAAGAYTSRTGLCLPTSKYYFDTFLTDLMNQLYQAIVKGGILTLVRGFRRGLTLIMEKVNLLFLVLSLMMSAIVCVVTLKKATALQSSSDHSDCQYHGFLPVLFMILTILAPLSPFFIIANPYFSLRAVTPCLLGAALLSDLLFRKLTGSHNRVRALLCSLFVFVCFIASASEINDYHRSYEIDQTVLQAVMGEAENGGISGRTGILELNPSMIGEQNMYYHEHVAGVTASTWSMTGALSCISNDRNSELGITVVPLATDDFVYYRQWNRNEKKLSGFDRLLYWDEETSTLHPLTMVQKGEEDYLLYSENGTLYAHVFEEDGFGYIHFRTEQ